MAAVARRVSPSGCRVSSTAVPRGCLKWADIDDGSDTSDDEELLTGLPLGEDSYREAPVAMLEDSRSGLNLGLSEARLGQSTAGAPKDFEFLFHCLEANAKASQQMQHEICPLNADAPEFIPTLSHDCPVIGFCEAIPEDSSVAPLSNDDLTEYTNARTALRSPRRRNISTSSADDFICSGTPRSQGSSFTFPFQEFGVITPTKSTSKSGLNVQSAAPLSSTKKSGAARKRHAAAATGLKCPAMKRSKSEEREDSAKVHPKGEMPELSPEDWAARCATRVKAIAFGKATPEYARYCDALAAGEEEQSGCQTPDPLDRTVSKRQWKYVVQQWRYALKRLHGSSATDGGDTGSTASADEGLSIITGITDEADATSTTYGDDGSSL